MTDESSIREIAEMAIAASHNADLASTAIGVVVVPAGMKVESLERFQAEPQRLRQAFMTQRVPDFIRYVQEERITLDVPALNHGPDAAAPEGMAGTVVYVDPKGHRAKALIDHGTDRSPLWGDHSATLRLEFSPEFAALKEATDKIFSQPQLAEWLGDWVTPGGPFRAYREETELTPAKAEAGVRKLTVKADSTVNTAVGEFKAQRTALDEIEIKATGEDILLDRLVLTAPVYIGMSPQTVVARLSVGKSEPVPFKFRIVREDEAYRAAAEELEARLRAELAGVRVFVGTVTR